MVKDSIYDYNAKLNDGKEVSLEKYRHKILLIVNTASQCGFTSQYEELQNLYNKYKGDLAVLAFPCNQFGGQEPGSDKDIKSFCTLNYSIKFPIFSKIEVNGESAHPLFDYLKGKLPGALGTKRIKWNFTKFLIDKDGRPVKRYAPNIKPSKIEKDITGLL